MPEIETTDSALPSEVSEVIEELVEEIRGLSKRIEGLLREGDNPVSMKCARVFEEPVPCYDFSVSRRFSACRAHQIMETEGVSWGEALKQAWDEVRGKCTWD